MATATATADPYTLPAWRYHNRRLINLVAALRRLRNHETMYQDALYAMRGHGVVMVRGCLCAMFSWNYNPAQVAAIRFLLRRCPLAFSAEQVAYWRRRLPV